MFDRLRSKQDPVHREGCGVPQNGGNRLLFDPLRSKRGPVHREGCGVPQNRTPRATVHPPSTASLQPPPATIHPPPTSSSLHQLLFIWPPPATVQPALHGGPVHLASTGYSSSSHPRGPLH